jgi:hypothetical protein
MTDTENDLRHLYDAPLDPSSLHRLGVHIAALADPVNDASTARPRKYRLMPLAAAVGVVATVLVVVLGANLLRSNDPGRPAITDGVSDSAALQLWAGFPVNASPRPLVLTGQAINDPATGFPDSDGKVAYLSGSYDLATALPPGTTTSGGQQVITAADALDALRAMGAGNKPVTPRLQITDVQLGTSLFYTDRGQQSLPAWLFTFAGIAEPASVLAIPVANRWPHTGIPGYARFDVQLAGDGRHLTIGFSGYASGSGPCNAEYTADVAQSSTAIAVTIRQLPNPNMKPDTMCIAMGYGRSLDVTLSATLGNRVIIDETGAPVTMY